MAAEAASFNTEIFSMSAEGISLICESVPSTPSIITIGLLFPNVPTPRTRTSISSLPA